MTDTQYDKVLRYIDEHGSITPMEAFSEFGITRLAARVNELQRKGIILERKMESGKNRFGENVRYMRYWRAV